MYVLGLRSDMTVPICQYLQRHCMRADDQSDNNQIVTRHRSPVVGDWRRVNNNNANHSKY